ncbi:reverse transcriptase domain, Reverse transcriptase zinc-binding domain protein [Artemisia annua]|uniref:Reverse transcriptase domain, Reverse transcriptase zinc-binding domain protein n=1 Tax=Artemisia annua TaxID=35608 RepID=A0A2U1KL19_ARTAN|nr:reverse transcriptase domain, Reverse transcriptase zinc-binding domain protein [Artemisia annua]
MHLHVKLKELKKSIKIWHVNIKQPEASRKHEVHYLLKTLEEKIDLGRASNSEREERINLIQECDDIEKLEAFDMIQKARIRWDVEGDENTKFFHGLIKQRRHQQTVQGLMIDGLWISDPYQVKEAFLNFFKEKFQSQDQAASLNNTLVLSDVDRFLLEDTIGTFSQSTKLIHGRYYCLLSGLFFNW